MDAISANRITGELMTRPEYRYIDGKLIAAVVNDTVDYINRQYVTAGEVGNEKD